MRELIKLVNKVNSTDPMCIAVLNACGLECDDTDTSIAQILNDLFFDTCSESMLEFYESECGLTTYTGQSLADRRSAVVAKWCSEKQCSLLMLQEVANAWNNGKTNITYNGQTITVNFIDIGIPTGLDELKEALNKVRPAHLPISYVFIYRTYAQLKTYTYGQLKSYTYGQLRSGGLSA